jgi:hypothetical protein
MTRDGVEDAPQRVHRDARGMLYAQNLALFGHRSDRLDVTPWVR